MSREVEAILEPSEKIVWQGVMSRSVLAFDHVFGLIIVGVASGYFFSQEMVTYTSNGAPSSVEGSTIGLGILVVGLFLTALSFFSNWVKVYTITNKRVLIKSGLIGTDFESIYFTEVKTANVSVGLVDKIFGVGTVNIDTGKTQTVSHGSGLRQHTTTRVAYDKLQHVSQPYEVYKFFQSTLTGRQESLYSGRADRESSQQK